MADDTTEATTQTEQTIDTTTSQSEQAVDTTAAETGAEGEGKAAEAETDEGTVLGGKEGEDGRDGDDGSVTATGAPEKYELALEGVTLDPEMITEAEPILRELNLTNDQANTLLPVAAKLVDKTQNATLQALADAGAQQKKDWLDAFHADPEIGGAKREETEHLAAKGLDALGYADGHPFRKALTESGFGNHPDMIRAMRKVGELVGEDGDFVQPAGAGKTDTPTEKRWYGKQGA